jgi:hypothetical protein
VNPLTQQQLADLVDFHLQVGNKVMLEYVRRLIEEVRDLRDQRAQSLYLHDIEESL